MSAKELTDAEVHELILARQASLSREEWQNRLDRAAMLFRPNEKTDGSVASARGSGKYRSRGANGHRPAGTDDSVLNGSHPKAAKPSKKKPARQTA